MEQVDHNKHLINTTRMPFSLILHITIFILIANCVQKKASFRPRKKKRGAKRINNCFSWAKIKTHKNL